MLDRRPRPAGPRRRARLPRRAEHHHHDLPEGPDRAKALGRLARHLRRRRRRRPAARRLPHRRALAGSGSSSSTCRSASPRSRSPLRLVPESRADERRGGFDLIGAVLVTGGPGAADLRHRQGRRTSAGAARGRSASARRRSRCWRPSPRRDRRAAPLVRLSIFRTRTLAVANAVTLLLRRRDVLVLLLRLAVPPADQGLQRARDRPGVPADDDRDHRGLGRSRSGYRALRRQGRAARRPGPRRRAWRG